MYHSSTALEMCQIYIYIYSYAFVTKSHFCHAVRLFLISVYMMIIVSKLSVGLCLRGDRTVNHVQDKGISKGHRQNLRPWDGKEQQFEAQTWHHNNSTRSFHNRAATNNGYLTGPGDRYTSWDHNISNSVVGSANNIISKGC